MKCSEVCLVGTIFKSPECELESPHPLPHRAVMGEAVVLWPMQASPTPLDIALAAVKKILVFNVQDVRRPLLAYDGDAIQTLWGMLGFPVVKKED